MINRSWTLLLLLAAAQASALKTDREQEMSVKSDRSTGKPERTELIGAVEIDQGSLKIRADTGIVEQSNGEVSRVVFNGSPATLQQEVEDQGLMRAQAAKIEYLLSEDIVVLTGDVVIERPRGNMRSERIVYHVDSGLLDAGSEGGRVQMTIKPKSANN